MPHFFGDAGSTTTPQQAAHRPVLTALVTAVLAVGGGPATAQNAFRFQQVAITGQTAPGVTGEEEYARFGGLVLNQRGDVAFAAALQTGDGPNAVVVNSENGSAIFGPAPDNGFALGLLAREDQPAPGVSDAAEFDRLGEIVLNDVGQAAFEARLRRGPGGGFVGTPNDDAVFGPAITGSGFIQVARENEPAPGVSDGAEFDDFNLRGLTTAGVVAFAAELRRGDPPGAGPVGETNNDAIFGQTGGSSAPTLLAREDALAPGTGDAAEFDMFVSRSPAFNATGGVAFAAFLRTGDGPVVSDSEDAALFASAGGPQGLQLVAREGQQPVGIGDGAVYNDFGVPVINSSADVAFVASLRTDGSLFDENGFNDRALFGPVDGAGSDLGLLARAGDPAPGVSDGAVFSVFNPKLNDAGQVAFEATLRTGRGFGATVVDGSNAQALFGPTGDADSPFALIAREGEVAPGVSDGAVFDGFSTSALNAEGDLAFLALLRAGADPGAFGTGLGLFAYVDGELDLILRNGDSFGVLSPDINGIETRVIERIQYSPTSLTNNFNGSGTLLVLLEFTDGTEGVFTVDLTRIPEPSALSVALVALVACCGSKGQPRP
ncbi:hypothetical protein Pla175_38990 [Pirellulimonas nuda]|uniref:Uncharacterized protein n=1 Tax=Pirellulimonas nuda TaxID=2528009 RepID=A0A518DG94_9BACT|nr:choice-of-anchor tandem repeat NxxGxxAF-containing protein [Pirellulimonas nuda]QDU90494.1 hypothetical protein Pla175_38990 [Pirellulimonas nuda]